ncbi:MAG: HAD family hydrolase [Rhodobacteraceae bacterium]|nr:HAD family hydrolase [Paracoccaceae bacterium]
MKIDGILFDKDGTLFDFQTSWGPWFARMLRDLVKDEGKAKYLAGLLDFDLVLQSYAPESVLIHGTIEDFLDVIAPRVTNWTRQDLSQHIQKESETVTQMPTVPLVPLFDSFITDGLVLGIATNDNEIPARAQLKTAGVLDRFAFIAGCDSGFGAKPESGMQHGFCEATGLDAARVAMVGDSSHDLVSGRNAGMQTIAVLTGVASRADLAPLADVVLDDIGQIAALIK